MTDFAGEPPLMLLGVSVCVFLDRAIGGRNIVAALGAVLMLGAVHRCNCGLRMALEAVRTQREQC